MRRYVHRSSSWIQNGKMIQVTYGTSSFFAGDFADKTEVVTPERFKEMFGYSKRKSKRKGGEKHNLDMA